MLVVLLFTCLLFTLAVSVFYSVFVVIYTTSFAGRYLSFLLTLCLCGSCLASLLLFTIFPTSRLGWVNLLTVCDLLFVLVLLCVILRCNGLFWSLLSCFVLYVFFYNVSRVINTVCWFSRLVVLVLS